MSSETKRLFQKWVNATQMWLAEDFAGPARDEYHFAKPPVKPRPITSILNKEDLAKLSAKGGSELHKAKDSDVQERLKAMRTKLLLCETAEEEAKLRPELDKLLQEARRDGVHKKAKDSDMALRDKIRAVKEKIAGAAGVELKRAKPAEFKRLSELLTSLLDSSGAKDANTDAELAMLKKKANAGTLDARQKVRLELLESRQAKDTAMRGLEKRVDGGAWKPMGQFDAAKADAVLAKMKKQAPKGTEYRLASEGAKDAAQFKEGDRVWANPIGRAGGTVKGKVDFVDNQAGQIHIIEDGSGHRKVFHEANVHKSQAKDRSPSPAEEKAYEIGEADAKKGRVADPNPDWPANLTAAYKEGFKRAKGRDAVQRV